METKPRSDADMREQVLATLNRPEHAPMSTHDGRDGSCTMCPVPLYELGPEEVADAILLLIGEVVAAERERCEAEDHERVARLMSVVTPIGYAAALALIEAETGMLREAAIRADEAQPVSVAELTKPPRFIHAGRDPQCVAAWPECESGLYDPRCCRFPKSCSADRYVPNPDAEPDEEER